MIAEISGFFRNLLKEMVDLETMIVLRIGRNGRVLPPISNELSEDTLEI